MLFFHFSYARFQPMALAYQIVKRQPPDCTVRCYSSDNIIIIIIIIIIGVTIHSLYFTAV